MLDKARGELCCDQPNKGIDFTVGDIFDIADRDGEKYDCILCLGLIAHTGRLQELLTLLARILTPSGKIVLQSSNADHLGILITRLLTKKWYLRRQGYKISYYSQSDIESAAHESGFQINSVTKYCVGIPILDRVLPKFNFWIENRFGDFAAKNGAEMILVLEKKALGSTS
jgi:SAM-dependent methyltransferase